MFIAIILPLYNQSNWPYLDDLFTEVMSGETDTAFLLADSYNARDFDGTYTDNSTEAFVAINCLDYVGDYATETLRAQAAELAEIAPVFGPRMSYGVGCERWPFPATRVREPIAAAGSADILVIGHHERPRDPVRLGAGDGGAARERAPHHVSRRGAHGLQQVELVRGRRGRRLLHRRHRAGGGSGLLTPVDPR